MSFRAWVCPNRRAVAARTVASFVWLLVSAGTARAQTQPAAAGPAPAMVQPRVMVIPYVTRAQDMQTVLESDFAKRTMIAEVKKAFDAEGFTTVDFVAAVRKAEEAGVFRSPDQTSIKAQVIQGSGADVYVEVQFEPQRDGGLTSLSVILSAYESSTANSLASETGRSPANEEPSLPPHVTRALRPIMGPFLTTLNDKWQAMAAAGRSVAVDVSVARTSKMKLSSTVGTPETEISATIEEWLTENAHNRYVHVQGITEVRFIADEVRLPLRDANGRPVSTSAFAGRLVAHLRKLGLRVTQTIRNNAIYLELQ